MADNLTTQTVTPATIAAGIVIATDDVGGVAFQRVKATWGADGTAVDVSAANPLPVNIAATGGAVPVSGTVGISGTVTVGTHAVTVSGTPNVAVTNTPHVIVDSAGATIPVSIAATPNVAVTNTPNVAVTSSVLPTGAATETTLAALNTKTPGTMSNFRTPNLLATPQSLKTSAGNLLAIIAVNNVATIRWLKFYDKATSPTVGTDTPILTIGVQASNYLNINFPASGLRFANGLWVAAVTGSADNSTTAPGSFDIIFQGLYI